MAANSATIERTLKEINRLAEKKKEIIARIDSVAHELPGIIIIHDLPGLHLAYMSRRGLQSLGLTLEQLIELGPKYNYQYFNDTDVTNHTQNASSILANNDPDKLVSFFQQMRPIPMGSFNWHMSTSKILLQDDNGTPVLAITIAQPIDNTPDGIANKLDRLLKDNDFLKNNHARFNLLTKRELEVLILIGNGKSVREVSEQLYVSLHTVESHRKNFRKKLNIKTNYDLQEYIRAFDLLQ